MSARSRPLPAAALALFAAALAALSACGTDAPTGARSPSADRAGYDEPGVHRQYGTPIKLGDGMARTYVVIDQKSRMPLEIGVAMDARLLEGTLPTGASIQMPLPLPPLAPAPWEFVLFDWNPSGHAPPPVYGGIPHFDFHFYRTPVDDVMAIQPGPGFDAAANDLPTGGEVPPFYILPVPPGLTPAAIAEPGMGLHWIDVRSPEWQILLGNPTAFQPFTRTLIYGSWAGEITFIEPMVTRAWLLTRTEETIPFPVPAVVPEAGWYPTAYRITYDARRREYRVGILSFVWRT
jgi:hypothetical protein